MIITFLLNRRIVTLNVSCRKRACNTKVGCTEEETTNRKLHCTAQSAHFDVSF